MLFTVFTRASSSKLWYSRCLFMTTTLFRGRNKFSLLSKETFKLHQVLCCDWLKWMISSRVFLEVPQSFPHAVSWVWIILGRIHLRLPITSFSAPRKYLLKKTANLQRVVNQKFKETADEVRMAFYCKTAINARKFHCLLFFGGRDIQSWLQEWKIGLPGVEEPIFSGFKPFTFLFNLA